ncbi:MAG: FKBP-type peptidyl-prolyl cis-trans isomerase [Bacteroidales bacterium]|jgi:FKBP-type peptidyl-prolyl cis-trans isomerase|nr:FKBP-type peptidyl-prolyl cis-trans isomerase [Bacteroidales bacterium]
MKKILLSLAVLLGTLGVMTTGCSQNSSYKKAERVDMKELKTLNDSISYIIGYSQGSQMAASISQDNLKFNKELLAKAFYQSLLGDTTSLLTKEQMQATMNKFQQEFQKQQQESAQKIAKPNREKAEKFLAENKTKDGVVTTESGLQYKMIKQGKNNVHPAMGERVRINYRLKTLDGKVVESTFESNEKPGPMGVSNFIPGFSEGLTKMTEGSTYMFWIKPDLAYGDNDSPQIPAGSLLCFEVELLEVIK